VLFEDLAANVIAPFPTNSHLGAGVTGDITIPEERGGYYSLFNLGPMVAPCVGPAVGGALAENLGWRSTFWALVIVAGFCLLMLYL
jgi:MFS family permease